MKFKSNKALSRAAFGAAAIVILAQAATLAAAADGPKPPPATAASSAEVKALFQDACGNCHELSVTTDQRKTRDDWAVTISKMIGYGTSLTDAQATQILDYLAAEYGVSARAAR